MAPISYVGMDARAILGRWNERQSNCSPTELTGGKLYADGIDGEFRARVSGTISNKSYTINYVGIDARAI